MAGARSVRSAAAGVVAAARARVAGARALHHAAALVAGRTELEVGANLGRDDRRGVREGRCRRLRLGLGLRLGLRGAVALAVRVAVATIGVLDRERLLCFLPGAHVIGEDPELLEI